MSLIEYAEKWGRDPEHNFALACAQRYNKRDLEAILPRALTPTAADRRTMQEHGLSREEWHDAISAAHQSKG